MQFLSVETLLCIAERFQTALVGVLGFAGVILTLLHNARETKRQGERALRNEQASVFSALHAELTVHRGTLHEAVAAFQTPRGSAAGKFIIPVTSEFPVYDALLPRIGILPSHKVRAVIYAYLSADTLCKSLIMFRRHGGDYEGDGDYVSVNVTRAEELTMMFTSVMQSFDKAIREVAPNVDAN